MPVSKENLLSGELKAKIVKAVEDEFDRYVEVAQEMIRIKSVNPEHEEGKAPDMHDGETKVNRYLQEVMDDVGMKTDLFATTAANRHNLVGVLEGSGQGKSLLFNGHIDVVGVGDINNWTVDPWAAIIKDDKLYGRGACDMKAGVACSVGAAMALKRAGVKLKGDVVFQSVVGEENMNTEEGTGGCIERGYRADAGVCVEPSSHFKRLSIMPASPGALMGVLHVFGKSTHSCMRGDVIRAGGSGNDLAASAFDKAIYLYQGFRKLEEEWGITKKHPVFSKPGHFTLNPGAMSTGPSPYVIPSKAEIIYQAWYPPHETGDQIKEELEAYLADLCQTDSWLKEHKPFFEWAMHWPSYNVSLDAEICKVLESCYESAMDEPAFYDGFPAVDDAAFLNAAGIPTITFGPGNLKYAHADDEFVELSELLDATKVYALLMAAWCGVEG